MKNVLKKGIAALAVAIVLVMGVNIIPQPLSLTETAHAASALSYKYKTVGDVKTYTGSKCTITVDHTFKKVVLSGSTKGIKKIKKSINKWAKGFISEESEAYETAEETANEREYDDDYFDRTVCGVKLNNGKILSIAAEWQWYAGGVYNAGVYGKTYNVKTGKELNIKKATGLSLKKIRKKVLKKLKKLGLDVKSDVIYDDGEEISVKEYLADMDADDFKFFLKSENKCVVGFESYELGQGTSAISVTIKY